MTTQYVQEIDVIIAVSKWLHSNGWQLEGISMPHGKGIDPIRNRAKLEAEFTAVGISISNIEFRSTGEDIRARKDGILWRIESKCLSSGTRKTDKSNFDRAIASTVSYYIQSDGLRLGLALPDDEYYLRLLRNKVPQALRVAINLWIFLCLSHDDILVFAPDEELPL